MARVMRSSERQRSAGGGLYRLLFTHVLARLDPERAHQLASRALRAFTALPGVRPLLRRLLCAHDPRLRVRALGLEFPSPLGLAAGYDKDASTFESLALLGFGYVEVGTITALEQPGNPRPRIFRVPEDRAVVNSMGFPNPGAEAVSRRLARRRRSGIVGINVGKTKRVAMEQVEADYEASVRLLLPVADYLAINVSSPNTPGLRDMQAADRLARLIAAARSAVEQIADEHRGVPLLLKIGPDLEDAEIDAIADLALALDLDGIVAVNSSVDASGLSRTLDQLGVSGPCGTSGAPLKQRSLAVLRRLRARVGDRLVLISVGGIETPLDAWERLRAGATLLQAHTGFVYGGPLWPHRMNRGLARFTAAAGLSSVQDVVGADEPRAPADPPDDAEPSLAASPR
jgi:dihydroorotate dehydrogenase